MREGARVSVIVIAENTKSQDPVRAVQTEVNKSENEGIQEVRYSS